MRTRKAMPVLLILLTYSPGSAQEATAEKETAASHGFYIVRPDDTLEDLTKRYLGIREWRENYELNTEQVTDPDLIYPGQRLELILPENLLPGTAVLRRVTSGVKEKPAPLAWREVPQSNELLRSRDGIRTYDKDSAEILFPDDTVLVMTEQSTVFLGEETHTRQVDRQQIEIVVGQADLGAPAVAKATTQFEIVLGDATATPRAGEDSGLQTRARRPQSGGAQLMVYSGESALEAAGAKVAVGAGMGSTVPEGKAPEPPEKLLPAPSGLEPADGAGLATPRPIFRWQTVDGARDYTIEVCRDRRCGSLVERVQALARATWQPEGLPVEKLYWRVTAVSPSGLDGYPSDTMALEVLTAVPDTSKPTVEIAFTDPRLAPRAGLNAVWIVGPGMEIEVEVGDEGSGVDRWTAKIDGEEVAVEGLKGPWEKGEHTVSVVAADRAGNRVEAKMPFIYDPDPPALSWGAEGDPSPLGLIEGVAEEAMAAGPDLRGRRQLRVGRLDWEADSDLAQIRLRPQTRKPIDLELLGSLGPEQGLWVLADDEVCSDRGSLSYALVEGAGKNTYVLWMKAVDCVGNAVVGQLPLARQRR